MTKLTVAFRSFENVPNKVSDVWEWTLRCWLRKMHVCLKGHLATAPQDVQTKRTIFAKCPGACERVQIVLGLVHKRTTKATPDFDTTLNTIQSLSVSCSML